jgi:hypothetical protein
MRVGAEESSNSVWYHVILSQCRSAFGHLGCNLVVLRSEAG